MSLRSKHIDKSSDNICLESDVKRVRGSNGFYEYLRSVSVDRNLSRPVRNFIAISIELRSWVIVFLGFYVSYLGSRLL